MPPHPCSGAGNAAQIFERTFGSQKYVARASDGLLSNKSLTESWVKVLGARGHSWNLFGASWRPAVFGILDYLLMEFHCANSEGQFVY